WSVLWMAGLAAVGVGAIVGGYYFSPHVADRIDGFVSPGSRETYQVDKAQEAIRNGGVFGRGAEGGAVKHQLPDAHTDFIFAVAAEEFGFIVCVTILCLFAVLVTRLFIKAGAVQSLFAQVAVCGLAANIGLQSFINIGVTLRALPAKGMTLPFISYGGSSLIAMGLTLGLAFALTRKPPVARRRKEIMP
ncbi:MAG: FtsW/RodA/SpoVE family cell cycle protein, partial [Pseudomonadota bacterium]